MEPLFKKVAIIGVGLIGGSYGMAVRQRGLASEVAGIGRNPDRLKRAVELDAIDTCHTDLKSGIENADLVYIATPVGNVLEYTHQIAELAKPGCIITDAGSTKSEICKGADCLTPSNVYFVGGHPMAGSEAAGIEFANPGLFVNATYVLTPTEYTNLDALCKMRVISESIGSKVVEMDPETHDRCAAVISHLPHIIAAAMVSLAHSYSSDNPQIFDLIAGSFRDMTRVAGSSPDLWRDICMSNPDGIAEAAERFKVQLDQGLTAVNNKDSESFYHWFENAKNIKDTLSKK
ncbi:MAG: prephenate dehydrogenase [Armatimonadota bacterium]